MTDMTKQALSIANDRTELAERLTALRPHLIGFGWAVVSVGLFTGIWEICWALGLSDPRLLPPPHIFLGNILEQGKYFNTAQTWQIGIADGGAASPAMSVLYTILSSTGRVLAGLA